MIIHADYTHSLVGALAISLVAMIVAMIPWGRRNGLSSDDRDELAELRRELRVTKMENEILKRAAAYFARENLLRSRIPSRWPAGS